MENWSEIKYVNFTYSSPNNDIETCTGLNPDGGINIKYTLTSMRDKLMENVQLLNKLLEKSDHITGLYAAEYDAVAICISSEEEMENMFKNNLIRDAKIDDVSESENESDIGSESDNETHSDRLRMMKNLIFSSESKHMSDSDEESSDDDFVDGNNVVDLIRKYDNLIEQNLEQESDTD